MVLSESRLQQPSGLRILIAPLLRTSLLFKVSIGTACLSLWQNGTQWVQSTQHPRNCTSPYLIIQSLYICGWLNVSLMLNGVAVTIMTLCIFAASTCAMPQTLLDDLREPMLRCANLMSLALRTRDVFDDPVRGICCPAILFFSTFYINHKPS